MEMKCEYCGAMIDATARECPNCGGVNQNMRRSVDGTPKTIEELKQWYIDRKLPPEETTRFFIGKNYTEPKAFGIYEENGYFIVYKNKANGQRAIRYEGTDEAYAVNELYLKLKEEILNQKSLNQQRAQSPRARAGKRGGNAMNVGKAYGTFFGICGLFGIIQCSRLLMDMLLSVFATLAVWVLLLVVVMLINGKQNRLSQWTPVTILKKKLGKAKKYVLIAAVLLSYIGVFCLLHTYNTPRYYLSNNGEIYCYYHASPYWYDGYDYYPVEEEFLPAEIRNEPENYGYEWDSDAGFTEFEDSAYYSDTFGSSSDSGYDWDSGSSWDIGGTDWGSDW